MQRRRIQEVGAQQGEYYRQGHRSGIQDEEALQGGPLQTGAKEEDSGGRSTAGGSTTDRGTGVWLKWEELSREEYYRQKQRRRIQEAGAEQEGLLQTGKREEDSGGRSTAGGRTKDRGPVGGFRKQEHSRRHYYRQVHRRRIQETGPQQAGVLQKRAQDENSVGRGTSGGSTKDRAQDED
ncbi:hypothetical protein NDU88_011792 [Pleurodeles waltl]|nr:hypothetical protein NDU88_011792 [Pleurodeles waltl]